MKNIPLFLRLLFAACVSASLTSCVTGPAVSASDRTAAASFTPPPGHALLYVYRTSSVSTMTAATLCWVDGQYVGKNGSGTFMAIPLKAGSHTINPIGNPGTEAGRTFPPVKISAVPGRNYFIRQKITPTREGMKGLPTGVVPGLFFEAAPVSESLGRQEVAKCRQVGHSQKF